MVKFKLYNNKFIKNYINNLNKCEIYPSKNNFHKLSEKKFLSSREMKELYCNFNMIINYSKINDTIPYQLSNNITKWINNMKKLNVDSAQGFVYLSDILKDDQQVIIKTSQNKYGNENLLIEYFIGDYALNNLRHIIPNFVYVYGIFQCPKINPSVKSNKIKLDNFCKKGKKLNNFVIYEKIAGKNLHESLATGNMTTKTFLKIFIQILIALEIAQQKYGFCHFDLHYDNILLRPVENYQYDVNIDNKTYSLKNQEFIATIIDYGLSCINYKQNDCNLFIGNYGLEEYGIMPFLIPIFDIYKILIFCLFEMHFKPSTNKLFKIIKKLFKFFKNDDPYHIIVNNELNKNNLRNAIEDFTSKITFSKIASYTPKMFLDWIIDNFTNDISDFIQVRERTSYQIINKLNLNPNIDPINCYNNSDSYIINKYNQQFINKLSYNLGNKNIAIDTVFLEIMQNLSIENINKKTKLLQTYNIDIKNVNEKNFNKFIDSIDTTNMNKLNTDIDLIYIYLECKDKYPDKIKKYYQEIVSKFNQNDNIKNYYHNINNINQILRWKEVYIYYLFLFYFKNISKKDIITRKNKYFKILQKFEQNGVYVRYLKKYKTV